MSEFIPLSVPNFCGNELKYVTEAIKSEWVSTGGAQIDRFEKGLANYLHVERVCALQSGTAGLHLAMILAGVTSGDEVIVPTLTFIAAVNPVRYVGAEPIFMDCDDFLCMDPEKLDSFCSEECNFNGEVLVNKRTNKPIKAVVVVHVFGNLARINEICSIAKRYNLKVIEDATEALGTYELESGRFAGTIGDFGVFSFNGNKIITTGGGGALVAKNSEDVKRAKHLSTQAKQDTLYFVHDEVGYNYRMTNLQAALGVAQLEQLEKFIKIKKRNYEFYKENGLNLLDFRSDIRSNYWFYSLITDKRDELIKHLGEVGIQSRPIWQLIHTLPMYSENQASKIEKACYYREKIVNIPCSSNLDEEDLMAVICKIKENHE